MAEASEHVLSFDWADVARQAAAALPRGHARGGERAAEDGRRLALVAPAAPATAWAAPGIHAHRGGSVLDGAPAYPENTMPAFRNASRAGYVLELDVKLTADRCRW